MDWAEVGGASMEMSLEQQVLAESAQSAGHYIRSTWFYRAMEAVRDVRVRSGLTQHEVASRLGTTQSAVARLENAHRGNFSLDRFLEYAWACGAGPLDFGYVPADELREYVYQHLRAPRTTEALRTWRLEETFRTWGIEPPAIQRTLGGISDRPVMEDEAKQLFLTVSTLLELSAKWRSAPAASSERVYGVMHSPASSNGYASGPAGLRTSPNAPKRTGATGTGVSCDDQERARPESRHAYSPPQLAAA